MNYLRLFWTLLYVSIQEMQALPAIPGGNRHCHFKNIDISIPYMGRAGNLHEQTRKTGRAWMAPASKSKKDLMAEIAELTGKLHDLESIRPFFQDESPGSIPIRYLASMLDNAQEAIIVLQDEVHKYVNQRTAEIAGCPEEQKISMTFPPYYWYKGCSLTGPAWLIPAAKVLPVMDQKLDRCKGKNDWGE
jgi:hypothetical protein